MIFMILNVLIAVTSGSVQNYYCKNLIKNTSDSYLFIIIVDTIALLGMIFVVKPGVPSLSCLGLAAVQGTITAGVIICMMEALRLGSFSLSTLFSLAALVIPVCASPFLWGEQLTRIQILGTVLMLAAMALTLNVGGTDKNLVSRRWLLFAFLTFLFCGLEGICEKYNQYVLTPAESGTFTFFNYVFLVLTVLLALVIRHFRTKEKITLHLEWKHALPVCFIGAGNPAMILLLLAALRELPTATFYGISNGSKLMLTTLLDVVLFKQKLKPVQFAGLGLGLAAIVLLSI